jgi:hypothetical protein
MKLWKLRIRSAMSLQRVKPGLKHWSGMRGKLRTVAGSVEREPRGECQSRGSHRVACQTPEGMIQRLLRGEQLARALPLRVNNMALAV